VQLADCNFYSCPEKRGCELQIDVFRLLFCVRRYCLYVCVCKYVRIYIYIYIYIYNLYSVIYTKTQYIITLFRVYCL